MPTALISGASIAGPALAYWLNRAGFQTTVVERAPAPRPGGQAIDVRGPALNTGTFQHGGQDADLFHTIRVGVPGSEMDPNPNLPDERVWQLVAYIKSLSAAARPPAAANAPAAPMTGNSASGETLFFGKAECSTCHEVKGRGGVVGPDLSTIGTTPAAVLRQKIVDTVYKGFATVGNDTTVPPSMKYFAKDVPQRPYDPDKAAFHFKKAGMANAKLELQVSEGAFSGATDAAVLYQEAMKKAGKIYDPVVYEGAGHGFMRAGEQPNASPANAKAREDSWKRVKDLMSKIN